MHTPLESVPQKSFFIENNINSGKGICDFLYSNALAFQFQPLSLNLLPGLLNLRHCLLERLNQYFVSQNLRMENSAGRSRRAPMKTDIKNRVAGEKHQASAFPNLPEKF
jgi:hypothetical protein